MVIVGNRLDKARAGRIMGWSGTWEDKKFRNIKFFYDG